MPSCRNLFPTFILGGLVSQRGNEIFTHELANVQDVFFIFVCLSLNHQYDRDGKYSLIMGDIMSCGMFVTHIGHNKESSLSHSGT